MSRLTEGDIKEVLAEHAREEWSGIGLAYDGRLWHCPLAKSPAFDFCQSATPHLRKCCHEFYRQFDGLLDPRIETCPLGFQVGVIPVGPACERPATVIIHLELPEERRMPAEASAAVDQLPRKAKKFVQQSFARVPAWRNGIPFHVVAPRIQQVLRRRADEKSADGLESVLSDYEDFVASFSHEALSPIQQVRSALERATTRVRGSDPEASELMDSALRGLDRVRVSLEGMRLLFRPDKTVLPNQYSTVDAFEILKHWVELYAEQFEAKNIDVLFNPTHGPWSIWAVKEYFEVLARNLVSNAVKYSFDATNYDRPGKVIFMFGAGVPQLTVTNFGVPITPEDIQSGRLFHSGDRGLYAHDRGRTGKGVGLYLVKKIAELHQAGLLVRSAIQNPGNSHEFAKTEFVITFRRRPQPAPWKR